MMIESPFDINSNLFLKFVGDNSPYEKGATSEIRKFLFLHTTNYNCSSDGLGKPTLQDNDDTDETTSPLFSVNGDNSDNDDDEDNGANETLQEKIRLQQEVKDLQKKRSLLESEVAALQVTKKRLRQQQVSREESPVAPIMQQTSNSIDVTKMGRTIKSLEMEFVMVSDDDDDNEEDEDDDDACFTHPTSQNTKGHKRRRLAPPTSATS